MVDPAVRAREQLCWDLLNRVPADKPSIELKRRIVRYQKVTGVMYTLLVNAMSTADISWMQARSKETGYPKMGDGFGVFEALSDYHQSKASNSQHELMTRYFNLQYSPDTVFDTWVQEYYRLTALMDKAGVGMSSIQQVTWILLKLPESFRHMCDRIRLDISEGQHWDVGRVVGAMRSVVHDDRNMRISMHDVPLTKSHATPRFSGNTSESASAARTVKPGIKCHNCAGPHFERECTEFCKWCYNAKKKKVYNHTNYSCRSRMDEKERDPERRPTEVGGRGGRGGRYPRRGGGVGGQAKAAEAAAAPPGLAEAIAALTAALKAPSAQIAITGPAVGTQRRWNPTGKRETAHIADAIALTARREMRPMMGKLDSACSTPMRPAVSSTPKPVTSSVYTAGGVLDIVGSPVKQYVAGLKRELEFSEVVGMTSEPLIPVYTTIITSGKTKQTRSPVVFNEDAGYQVPLSFLKPGWDAADHKVAVQRRGTYDVALAASGSDEQKQTTVAQWMHSEIAAGTARGKSLRTALVAIMTALGVDPNVVLPVEESA